MRLFEHEAKRLLQEAGIGIPAGVFLTSPAEIEEVANRLPFPVVLKAQALTGGRQKVGGVSFAQTPKEAATEAERLLGLEIRGLHPEGLLFEERVQVQGELFLAVTYDNAAKEAIVLLSKEGGVEVETAAAMPGRVIQYPFDIRRGFFQYQGREAAAALGLTGQDLLQVGGVLSRLVHLFLKFDATLVEVNPLARTIDGRSVALDAHLELDDDALSRHPELERDYGIPRREGTGRPATAFEAQAAAIDASDHRGVAGRVVEFDGNLGLLIGGGGASLTAFDAIKRHGGRPANYCEIGGNPSVRKVALLTKLILSRPGVEKLAVIMNVVSNTRVDLVARGVIKGVVELGLDPSQVIAVFRIPGSWEEEGVKILRRYGVPHCDRTVSIDEAARRAVAPGEKR
ncbi:MAG: acetate--CoA ligase family protein [candidate division NC10 bacterium]|nr:acetate--CoA ligase family protein [candidate division NC10 bacterium]